MICHGAMYYSQKTFPLLLLQLYYITTAFLGHLKCNTQCLLVHWLTKTERGCVTYSVEPCEKNKTKHRYSYRMTTTRKIVVR